MRARMPGSVNEVTRNQKMVEAKQRAMVASRPVDVSAREWRPSDCHATLPSSMFSSGPMCLPSPASPSASGLAER